MPCMPKSVDQVADDSTDLYTQVLQNCKIPTTKMAPPPEEDQVKGTPMDKDAGEAEAEEVEVNVLADEGSQCPDDGASQLPDDKVDEDGSESLLPPSLPPAEDSSSDTEDEFPSCHPGHHVEHKPKSKGKSRAMDNAKFKKTGNLSHAALNEIHDFVTKVKAKADELGHQHGKSPCDILVTAGLSVKPSHTKLNKANLFHSWYWATQPKPDGTNQNTVNNIIMAEYNQLMKDIPKDDTAARKEKLQAIYEWIRVHNAKTQFSRLAEVWLTLEDIEIAGVVMYVGQDPAGHQTSGIFGGSNII
ncbi:hypothetical protein F5J12DRAFT_785815 [Pisolithus orientalis]|uniref:uncharacterized protein n=1 Tax=Pisolithus orientalis TaxID=936130 RepID=UPI00222482EF|nr:uncharacterized protein F5J12DRAFT_785815 [Pisolithus orientalis]KAI5994251.1 hypothetical protein F5J12DRAFT_785815 [Pisolithus orientalis]